MRQTVWGALIVGCCLIPGAFGQQISVDFDPALSKINWSLAGNVHTTHGTFQLKQGHVEVDAATGRISGELVVEANSGDSANAARDKRMKKEILETEKYPEIRFKVNKLEGVPPLKEEATVRVSGQLTIHGASHEVTVPMQISLHGSEWSGTGKFVVPFVEWGMKDPSNFLFKVDKTVEVELVARGQVKR